MATAVDLLEQVAQDGEAHDYLHQDCPFFRHVGEVRNFHRALARSSIVDRVYQAGTDQMSRTIARRMSGPSGRAGGGGLPPDFLAQAFAGALFALLRWWVDREAPHSPKRMDAMYHAIVRTSAGQPHS